MPRPREKNGGDIKGLQAEPSSRACTISRRRKMSERTANLSHFNVEVPRANNAHSPQKLLERESSDVSCTTNARGRKEGRKNQRCLSKRLSIFFSFTSNAADIFRNSQNWRALCWKRTLAADASHRLVTSSAVKSSENPSPCYKRSSKLGPLIWFVDVIRKTETTG